MSPKQGSGIIVSLGHRGSCESESDVSKLFSQILCQTARPLHNSARSAASMGSVAIPPRWEDTLVACKWGWRRAGCGPDRALSTSSWSKWHHRSATSQLPHGG